MEITGIINEHGKLVTHQNAELNAWFAHHIGKAVKLKLSINHKKRSNNQNGYYWGCVIPMVMNAVNLLGNEWNEDDTHTALKAKFNSVEVVNEKGVSDDLPGSTTGLSTVEFEEYLEKVRRWAAVFLNLVIPLPNEQMTLLLAQYDPKVKATIVQ